MPADFKTETIDEYNKLNQEYTDSKIFETYGQLAPDTLLLPVILSKLYDTIWMKTMTAIW
jgi:hypothetical protein